VYRGKLLDTVEVIVANKRQIVYKCYLTQRNPLKSETKWECDIYSTVSNCFQVDVT
jgi:hypothetical protein